MCVNSLWDYSLHIWPIDMAKRKLSAELPGTNKGIILTNLTPAICVGLNSGFTQTMTI